MGHRAGVTPPQTFLEDNEPGWPTSTHAARRFIMGELPGASPMELAPTDGDPRTRSDQPPALKAPNIIEGETLRAIRVAGESTSPESKFYGFLDGAQQVRIVGHRYGVPIVWATVSAAVRVRENRRLTAWSGHLPLVERRFYVPLRYVADMRASLRDNRGLVDTGKADRSGAYPSRHPAALLESAMQKIQEDREALEQKLAEAWCESETSPLYIDGSITASRVASNSSLAVGVIKSHNTLYAEGDAFQVLVGLEPGERSSAFHVPSKTRNDVASWYVRVRSAAGRDALFGLVRVEASLAYDLTARADEISRWIIAEGSPLALPDGRWDKMSYGIRDTEEFLRAIS